MYGVHENGDGHQKALAKRLFCGQVVMKLNVWWHCCEASHSSLLLLWSAASVALWPAEVCLPNGLLLVLRVALFTKYELHANGSLHSSRLPQFVGRGGQH
eukprot:2919741-Amphidinium_carterae.1